MRVKIIKNDKYIKGTVANLPKQEALDLIAKGIAILTKDMTEQDGITK
jgi:hypothetical protein